MPDVTDTSSALTIHGTEMTCLQILLPAAVTLGFQVTTPVCILRDLQVVGILRTEAQIKTSIQSLMFIFHVLILWKYLKHGIIQLS